MNNLLRICTQLGNKSLLYSQQKALCEIRSHLFVIGDRSVESPTNQKVIAAAFIKSIDTSNSSLHLTNYWLNIKKAVCTLSIALKTFRSMSWIKHQSLWYTIIIPQVFEGYWGHQRIFSQVKPISDIRPPWKQKNAEKKCTGVSAKFILVRGNEEALIKFTSLVFQE